MMATQTLSIDNYQDGQQVSVFFFLHELIQLAREGPSDFNACFGIISVPAVTCKNKIFTVMS